MCGIVGIIGNLETKDEGTMKRLFVLDYFRGPDSTGLAAVKNNFEVNIAKINDHPFSLFDMMKFRSILNGNQSRVFLGHNRAATRGMVNTYNAHPFTFGHITGAHNGTLENSTIKALEEKLGEKFAVDSQVLYAAIAAFGIKETIEMCEGAWSLAWYDAKEDTFNLLRNKERPMWYGYTADFKKILIASEWWMLDSGARLSQGYDFYVEPKDKWRYMQTEENVHYRWSVEELRKGGKDVPKPKVRTLKGKEPVARTSDHPFHRSREERYPSGISARNSGSRNRSTTTSTTTSRSSDRVTHVIGRKGKPFGDFVTEEEYLGMCRNGCGWCQGPVNFNDRGQTVLVRHDVVLCPNCSPERDRNRVYTKIDYYLDH